jgi:hypothetical protein
MNIRDLIIFVEQSDKIEFKGTYYISKHLADYIKDDLGYLPTYLKVIGEEKIDEN